MLLTYVDDAGQPYKSGLLSAAFDGVEFVDSGFPPVPRGRSGIMSRKCPSLGHSASV